MKSQLLVLISYLLYCNYAFAQDLEWEKMGNHTFQKVVHESSNTYLKKEDTVVVQRLETKMSNGQVYRKDYAAEPLKLVYKHIQAHLNPDKLDFKFKIQSEYLMKIELPKGVTYTYSIYLYDKASDIRTKKSKI